MFWWRVYAAIFGVDPADDGPEANVIRFFRTHPKGKRDGLKSCFHIQGVFREFSL
jgi:hypothetical protein